MKSMLKTTRARTKPLAFALTLLLLLTLVPAPLVTYAAYSDDLSEYNLESEYFVFHESMHDSLFLNCFCQGKSVAKTNEFL
ncbi:MAG: hypothetical protein FWH04_10065 [Oscillospiraceae bacterium]|nr:hypothetical protein [Oscillospiraceae bacterium]